MSSIEFDRHGSPITVAQIICPTHLACSYVVSCGRTHAAVVIDPESCTHDEVQDYLEGHGLLLRYVLKTRGQAEQRSTDTASRYTSMLSSLGLDPVHEVAPAAEQWGSVPTVKPAAATDGPNEEGHVLIDVLGSVIRVDAGIHDEGAHERLTVRGPQSPPPGGTHFAVVRVAVGAFHLLIIPLEPGRLAFLVRDRLFSGSALRSDATADTTTHDTLLDLADHTIVYPSHASETVSISIIAQEARLGMVLLED